MGKHGSSRRDRRSWSVVLSTAGLLTGSEALAQGIAPPPNAAPAQSTDTDAGAGIPDIIVTAQKRSTSLQKTPLAITALSGEALQRAQVRDLGDINGLVPSLRIGEAGGYAQITLRGIGINSQTPLAESAVALNLNEVYVSRPIASLSGLYDVTDLEVLRGPQGTLYGRNATAGAVNITTARPTDVLSGYANLTAGSYRLIRAEGAVGGPLIGDKLLFRIAGFREQRHGYGTNTITHSDVDDKNDYGVRATLVFKPATNIKATLIAEHFEEHDNGSAFHYFSAAGLTGLPGAIGAPPVFSLLGGTEPSDSYDVTDRYDPKFRLHTTALTGLVELGNGPFTVKSITGYRDQSSFTRTNISGGDPGAFVISGEPAHQFSQEVQAHYDTASLHLTGGLFYFHEHDNYRPGTIATDNAIVNLIIPGHPVPGFTRNFEVGGLQKVRAEAAFGEAIVNLTDKLSITAGLRYSSERKQLTNRFLVDFFTPYTGDFRSSTPIPGTTLPARTFNSTTPKVGVQYQASPDTMLYASYSKGFKSGGFSVGTDDVSASAGYSPEKLTDYEAGVKTRLFDNRLRLSLAGFYYDYTDLQVLEAVGTAVVTVNAATARVYGAEAEFSAVPTPALTIDGSISWLHSRYGTYVGPDALTPLVPTVDFAGRRLNNAPSFQGHLTTAYQWKLADGSLSLRGELEYSSKFFFTATNILEAGQKAFAKAHASLTYTSNAGWYARAFMRNITDKTTRTSAFASSILFGTPLLGALAPPRTYGLELGYRF